MRSRKAIPWITLLLVMMFLVAGPVLAGTGDGGTLCGSSGPVLGENGLIVKKDVVCSFERVWQWVITKVADTSTLLLSVGQSFDVTYSVEVNASSTDSGFAASGQISILNPTEASATITGVADSLGPVTCQVGGGSVSTPFELMPGNTAVCSYAGALGGPAAENVASVTDASGVVVTAVAPIDWSQAAVTAVDECVAVSDSYLGGLGTVCAGFDPLPMTFTYTRTVGPFGVCGAYTVDNTAVFTTEDTGASGSSSWSVGVEVPCAGGCSLTPGYWKTHSIYGPAPYDDTWALLGEGTAFFLSGKTYSEVLWTSPSGGNAYYILAHAYIAATLNGLNGADTSAVAWQLAHAAALFGTYSPSSSLSRAVRADFINTATVLDQYNNGLIGPGHCSE